LGQTLDAAAVRRWCALTAEALGRTRSDIDALNVFPVPDGDTGTNLYLTVLSAAESITGLPPEAPAPEVWRALAQGALLGARGNSGMILSQILRGLAEVLGKQADPADGRLLAAGFEHATALARTAVGDPKEGTILSVAQSAAAEAKRTAGECPAVARAAARAARQALAQTPSQLAVLAENGVVDAGAAGLCVVLDVLAAITTDEYPEHYEVPGRQTVTPAAQQVPHGFGYEVMYLLDAADETVPGLRAGLERLGDSLVVGGGDGLWNVHVHVADAGAAIEAGLAVGRPRRIRITYLEAAGDTPQAPCVGRGVVAVTAADGLAELFEEGGAAVVRRRSGGVPRLAVLLEAILSAGDEVVVLPNEPEVIGVAEAAAQDARQSGVQISVVPTKASVQGLAALAVHDPRRRFADDVIAMTRAAGATRFGQLEIATQQAITSVGICQPGDVLGLIEGDVGLIGADQTEVAVGLLDRMLSGGGELVTLIPGLAAPEGLAEVLQGRLHTSRPDVEVAVYDGRQERYPLLIGVE